MGRAVSSGVETLWLLATGVSFTAVTVMLAVSLSVLVTLTSAGLRPL